MGNPADRGCDVNFDPSLTDYEREIFSNVAKFGCHLTTVFDPHDHLRLFTYSTGFTFSIDQGDVIIFGLPSTVSSNVIKKLLVKCKDGLIMTDGMSVSGLLNDFDIVIKKIIPGNISIEEFNSANWFHYLKFGRPLDRAFQLVWPDSTNGFFPWQQGCGADVIELQPALYLEGLKH